MPATDYLAAAAPLASLGRSLFSLRRDSAGEPSGPSGDAEEFQRLVASVLAELSSSGDDGLLSLSWIGRLLDGFLVCFENFRSLVFAGTIAPPLDRMVADFFDRAVKALDVCNAVRDGAERIRQWRHHLDIVAAAVAPATPLAEGRLCRARKALADLALATIDDDDHGAASVFSRRNRSFNSDKAGGRDAHRRSGSGGGHARSLSWSVSRTWSAARQLQAIGSGLAAPRGHEVVATHGLALPVYAMNSVLLFTMWALVAAIPCQDRGLQAHFSAPRSFPWAGPMLALHERILEESKKKERKNSNGLLKEIYKMEKSTRHLMELIDNVHFPITEEKDAEIRQAVQELAEVSDVLKDGLGPMERQVREVFRSIVRIRTEGLDFSGKSPFQ